MPVLTLSPLTWLELVIAVLLLTLIIAPGLARTFVLGLDDAGKTLKGWASGIIQGIRNLFGLQRLQEKIQRHKNMVVRQEIRELRVQNRNAIAAAVARGENPFPSVSDAETPGGQRPSSGGKNGGASATSGDSASQADGMPPFGSTAHPASTANHASYSRPGPSAHAGPGPSGGPARVRGGIGAIFSREGKVSTQLPLTPRELKDVEEEMIANSRIEEPSAGDLVNHWARRMIYLVLVVVCAVSDFVLVSSRVAPLLFGGGALPPFLVAIFSYLQIITGVLFVSIAALSGMLIDEHSAGISEYVKLEPMASKAATRTKLIIAISMFVINIVTVIGLAVAGVLLQFAQETFIEVLLVITIGATLLVALGVFMAWAGWTEGAMAIISLVLGLPTALILAVGNIIARLLSAFFQFFVQINQALIALIIGDRSLPPPPPLNEALAIIGFGNEGSRFAVQVCEQFKQVHGPKAWITGICTPDVQDASDFPARLQRTVQIARTDISTQWDENDPGGAATALTRQLGRYYASRKKAVKPLLWVVSGEDLDPCLPALQSLANTAAGSGVALAGRSSNKNKKRDKDPDSQQDDPHDAALGGDVSGAAKQIRLVLVWLLPPDSGRRSDLRELAGKLEKWVNSQGDQCILETTIVIDDDSPLSDTLGAADRRVVTRSVAALAGATFTQVAAQMRKDNHLFAALACGSIGVDGAPMNFQEDGLVGRAGEINAATASNTLRVLARDVFDDEKFSTTRDKWSLESMSAMAAAQSSSTGQAPATDEVEQRWRRQQAGSYLNVVVPTTLRQPREFRDIICNWLPKAYRIVPAHVSVWTLQNRQDRGINIEKVLSTYTGDFYLHLTVLRGFETNARPVALGGPSASSGTSSGATSRATGPTGNPQQDDSRAGVAPRGIGSFDQR